MISKTEEKMEEFPDTPAWTMFFDGPLYQKYDEFMKNKDFSKILLNTKLKLANSQGPEVVSSTHSIEYDHWDKEQDTDPTEHTYPYVSDEFYRKVKEDQKRRTRKTRAFILLGLVIMAALAFGTALVIHYFFIPPLEERNPKNFVNVSFSVNTTSSNVSDIEQTTAAGDLTNLLDTLANDPHHHAHGHEHEQILNPDGGKIFDDRFITTTAVPAKGSADISTTTTKMTAKTPMTKIPVKTPTMSSKTAVYVLHLKPKKTDADKGNERVTTSQKYSTTAQINHMDFFGMDESHGTTNSFDSTGTYGDFFTYDDLTTTTEAQTTPKLEADKTSHAATSKSTSVESTTLRSTTTAGPHLTQSTTKPETDTTLHAITSKSTSTESITLQSATTSEAHLTQSTIKSETDTATSKSTPAESTTLQAKTTEEVHLTQSTTKPEADTTSHAAPSISTSPESTTLKSTSGSQLSQNRTATTLKKEDLTQTDQTTSAYSTSSTIAIQNDTTKEQFLTTSSVSSKPLLKSTLTPIVTEIETSPTVKETTIARMTTALSETSSAEAVTSMSDVLSETNSTNSGNNLQRQQKWKARRKQRFDTVIMRDVTSYTFETTVLQCNVKHAIRWQSLSIRINQTWRPLEVTLFPDGEIKWSRSKTRRHDVSFDIKKSTDGTGSNMTLGLIINDVQCRDGKAYFCTLKSEVIDRVVQSRMIVLGKPSQKIKLTFGPSIIENKAFRITASWQGGYPQPWTNMSWTAIDSNNNSYDLAKYGDYRDNDQHADHNFCQTTLERSIVVFPPIHLNDTTVIVKPNLKGKKYFVDEDMEKYLQNVEPGIDKILVIPMDYCKESKKETKIPHPYTACKKFVRCLPGDMVVQQCPIGTCFFEKAQECA